MSADLPLGALLAAARADAGLTVEQISRSTKIRAGLIRQIEAGDFAGCGGAVYARGHLRALAAAIGIDAAPLVARHDADHGAPESAPVPAELLACDPIATRELRERRGTSWQIPMAIALGVVTLIAGIAYFGPGNSATIRQADSKSTTAPVVSTPTIPAPSPTPDLLAFTGVVVSMRIIAQPSWIHVEDGTGRVLFEDVLLPGATKEFRSTTAIKVVLGNAGAVDLTVNGRHLGPPDRFGQVFRATFVQGDPGATQS